MTDEPRARSAPKGLGADRDAQTLTQDNAPQTGLPAQGGAMPGGGTPSATLGEIGAAARKAETSGAAREAIDRATAPNGTDAGE
ncbi:hypothetical protein ASF49_00040 [Methylobacterium sp. Leaf104]|uniref:hypothetical protein n=1 Tax=Methylobacterium TaxID=407 RepID=UPI0006F5E288|nr:MULTISPECIES: hypothetical protein [Methylobacterium]KQP42292.1 hypothetical protein ASF49_00040 [Methylobacterium sp. Leaf104]MCI9879198.1 hypothetical protein [Methylobacterium goesingense]